MAAKIKRTEVQLPLFVASDTIIVDPLIDPTLTVQLSKALDKGSQAVVRTAAFHPSTVFKHMRSSSNASSEPQTWNINGVTFSATPKRLHQFRTSMQCVKCSHAGSIFLVEKHIAEEQQQYINLYAVAKNGTLVMITCDHILPDSFAGRYHRDNFQTMCSPCNQAKTNRMSNVEIQTVLLKLDNHVKDWVDEGFIRALLELHLVINREHDRTELNMLRGTFNKYLKGFSFRTTAVEYYQMRGVIETTLKMYHKRKRNRKIRMWFIDLFARAKGIFGISVDVNAK